MLTTKVEESVKASSKSLDDYNNKEIEIFLRFTVLRVIGYQLIDKLSDSAAASGT